MMGIKSVICLQSNAHSGSFTCQATAAAGQESLVKQQEELERKAAELERKEQELQKRTTGRTQNTGGRFLYMMAVRTNTSLKMLIKI